jgi:hypothetical protein
MAKRRYTGYRREVEMGQDGSECWGVPPFSFSWHGGPGVNLWIGVAGSNEPMQPGVRCESLKLAGEWAEGFVCGWQYGKREAQG